MAVDNAQSDDQRSKDLQDEYRHLQVLTEAVGRDLKFQYFGEIDFFVDKQTNHLHMRSSSLDLDIVVSKEKLAERNIWPATMGTFLTANGAVEHGPGWTKKAVEEERAPVGFIRKPTKKVEKKKVWVQKSDLTWVQVDEDDAQTPKMDPVSRRLSSYTCACCAVWIARKVGQGALAESVYAAGINLDLSEAQGDYDRSNAITVIVRLAADLCHVLGIGPKKKMDLLESLENKILKLTQADLAALAEVAETSFATPPAQIKFPEEGALK